jgi:hypothetical protein
LAVHNPMIRVHTMDFTSLMFKKIVGPFISMELERLLLAVDVAYRGGWSVTVEEELAFV